MVVFWPLYEDPKPPIYVLVELTIRWASVPSPLATVHLRIISFDSTGLAQSRGPSYLFLFQALALNGPNKRYPGTPCVCLPTSKM